MRCIVKWTKKSHLTFSSISPFIVTITTLIEYRLSLISRPDLFCNRKYIVANTFETIVQRLFKGFLRFFKPSYETFHLLPRRIKNKRSKNWIHFLLIFSILLKIKHGQNITESHKRPKTCWTRQKVIQDGNEKSKGTNTRRTSYCLHLPLHVTLNLLHLPLHVTLHLLHIPMPQDQTILMFMALVCLLSLPLVFVYFLHITLFNLKIKILSMKNRINHQNSVICFRKVYNKWVVSIEEKKLKTPLKMDWW